MYQGQWLAGINMSWTSLTPIESDTHEDGEDEDHLANVDVMSTMIFGMVGISDKLNLKISVPYIWRRQSPTEHEDKPQHRNEIVSGFGDVSLGFRTIYSNNMVGPGKRIFVDAGISLPTAATYTTNPFNETGEEESHSNFALGTGQYSASLGVEYWVRSESPWILGLSGKIQESLNTSSIGFKPGRQTRIELHMIKQKSLINFFYPYFKLSLRQTGTDQWDGQDALNSGGSFLDGFAQMDFELNESSSLILSAGIPLWQDVSGSQLSGVTGSISFRITI